MQEVDQLDELKGALADLRDNLGYGSKIGCVVNTSDIPITRSRIANAMVPVSVVLENPAQDSTLFVFDASWSDSAVDATIGFRKKVWQATSANLKHIFTVNPR